MTTALYRRYRPDSFAQVIGQEHVTDPLRAALRANKVTHAYLFSGPRGCGKTTSARILARCLNCAQGPTDTPCGECDSCRELATGGPGSLDVVEIDAASHGGVDDARELRERATFAPVRDRYKVFIIDEAHMVTPQGFNALLKLVEEPPEHVKFVFATTEPDRVLGTIRSRTHHYPFRLVPPDALEPYLAQLSHEEGITVAPGVLSLVMRAGGGSVRDTLSVLDQLMAGTIDGTLAYHQAVALLGYTDSALLDETVDALAGGDGAAVYRVIERMVESGHDPRRFVEDLLQRLRDLLIISVAGDGAADVLIGTPADQLERMITQARNWGPRHLSRSADLTDQALRAMVGATSPRLQLELLIGRILLPAHGETSVAEPALPGTVGMSGGGAPHEPNAHTTSAQPGSDQTGSEGRRFGAAQAREELRRKRQTESASPASGQMEEPPSSPDPMMPSPHTTPVAPALERERNQGAMPTSPTPPNTPNATTSPAGGGWADVTPAIPGAGMNPSGGMPPQEAAQGQASPMTTPAVEPTHEVHTSHKAQAQGVASQPTPVGPATRGEGSASRESDMLRQRWPEVIERLSSISRVAWALIHENGQLGGVDGTTAVVLLPTEGLVARFVGGNRALDVERAIHEATGLTLTVIAQVGQAGGGSQVTTPTAAAPAREAGVVTHKEDSASADPFRVEPDQGQASEPTFAPENNPVPEPQASVDSGWPTPAILPGSSALAEPVGDPHPQPEEDSGNKESSVADHIPENSGWPEAVVPPRPSDENKTATPDPFMPASPQALSAWQDTNITRAQASVHTPPSVAPLQPTQDGASSVFGDDVYGDEATGKTSANAGPARSAGFTRPRLTSVEGSPEERQRSDAALTSSEEKSSPAPIRPQVSAAEDDSASIDDIDVEHSQSYGLPAVFEILGGKVIEEKTTEGGW